MSLQIKGSLPAPHRMKLTPMHGESILEVSHDYFFFQLLLARSPKLSEIQFEVLHSINTIIQDFLSSGLDLSLRLYLRQLGLCKFST